MMGFLGFAVAFLVFVIVVVIIILTIKWGLQKAGYQPDPTLQTIVGLILFVILLIVFLSFLGYGPATWSLHR